jgi:hypothetical protein
MNFFILNIFITVIYIILFFNFFLFYLDGFNLSNIKYIRISQKISPVLIIALIYLIYNENIYELNVIMELIGDNNKSSSSNSVVSAENVGLGASIGGVAAATASVIAKSSLPPATKVAIVTGAGAVGGAVYVGNNALNNLFTNKIDSSSTSSNVTSGLDGSVVKKFIESGTSDLSNLLLSIDIITYTCLTLIIILFFIILFKFYLNENINLNLSRLIGVNLNSKLNYYIIKLIQFYKKSSSVTMFMIFIILIIGLSYDYYFIRMLNNNLDLFINLHINK